MHARTALAVALVSLGAVVAGTPTASASHETGNGVVCLFEGLAGNLTPGIQDILADLTDPTPLDIERGTYQFFGRAACVGRVDGTVFAPSATEPQNVVIVSDGEYDNVLCGTGVAHDQDGSRTELRVLGGTILDVPQLGPPATRPPTINGVGYEIPFIFGHGAILIGGGLDLGVISVNTNISGFADAPPASTVFPHDGRYPDHRPHQGVTGAYIGAGAVRSMPGDGQQPPTTENCILDLPNGDNTTDEFLISGAFAAVGKPNAGH